MATTDEKESIVIVDENASQRLLCRATGFRYTPDTLKYKYGKSVRRPLEDWFLDELRFFERKYPGFEIFTLGSSCVFGEKFINYLTICEFDLTDEASFDALKIALRDSDQAIRRKLHPMWKWDFAAKKGSHIVFMVGHMDLAYFLQHRKEFQGKAHSRYMSSFTTADTKITSQDYKVLQNGEIVAFDADLLDSKDRFVFDNYQHIKFETEKIAKKPLKGRKKK